MSEDPIPYREGEPPPGEGYIRARIVDKEGKDQGLFWVKTALTERSTPMRHEEVDTFLPVIRWQWRHMKACMTTCRTFEDWERRFVQHTDPAEEAAMWTRATYTFLEFTHRKPTINKGAVFGAVVNLMNGREDLVKTKTMAKELKRLMENPPAILFKVENFTKDGRLKAKDKHLR